MIRWSHRYEEYMGVNVVKDRVIQRKYATMSNRVCKMRPNVKLATDWILYLINTVKTVCDTMIHAYGTLIMHPMALL